MDLFVCGTDTACGKTVVTAALAFALSATGSVAVIKPAQTGSPPDDDAAWAAAVAGPAATPHVWERFAEALAPSVAAQREGRTLDLDDLAARTRAVQSTHRLCEAAGGLLAPLTADATMADLAAALGWPVVVAIRPGLGTLNHTALTVEAAARRGLRVPGLVVSGYRGGVVEDTNLEGLAGIAPLLGVVPWMTSPRDAARDPDIWRVPVDSLDSL